MKSDRCVPEFKAWWAKYWKNEVGTVQHAIVESIAQAAWFEAWRLSRKRESKKRGCRDCR